MYRLTEHLNAVGIRAAVMHQSAGFRPSWFGSSAPVVDAGSHRVSAQDVLVFSELDAATGLGMAPGVPKVVLNQCHFWTFAGGPVDYGHPDVSSVIGVSAAGVELLAEQFPGLQPHRLHLGTDSSLFRPLRKKRVLLYPESKGAQERNTVLGELQRRSLLDGWEVEGLSGLSQGELAQRLGEAQVLLTFSREEGFQMLLTEALAAGVAVVGYDGGGGAEYLTEQHAWPVSPGAATNQFVERVEEVLRLPAPALVERVRRGRAFVLENYTLEQEAADVRTAVEPALATARQSNDLRSFQVRDPRLTRAARAGRRARGALRQLKRMSAR